MICPHFEAGCRWEGKLHDYHQHKENCDAVVDLPSFKCGNVHPFCSIREQQENDHCSASAHVRPYELEDCKNLPHSGREQCPISSLTPPSTEDCYQHEHHLHMQESDHSVVEYSHLTMMANYRQLLTQREIVPVPASDHEVDMAIVMNTQELNVQKFQVSLRSENEIQGIHNRSASFTMQELEDAIVLLNSRVAKLKEKTRFLNTKLKEHNFRLSLIEKSNHDGMMIWKISQFGQRKADAENGRSTSLFSQPFYSGRHGYKMCLRLYIMGDGIGKGTHLSLFFVVMCGEFDNILQWPFTHKVTFKLINQAGGEDIVDTFKPDPMSNSFRKPISDMNISSGCPRFVSHTELERSGLIIEDTIFIKCIVDTTTIFHP